MSSRSDPSALAPPSPSVRDAAAFDFYPERWSQGTRHMSKVERCDYVDLLCFQWNHLSLPEDLEAVARILGYRRAAQIPPAVLEKFPVWEDGKRRNRRLEIVRKDQRERIASRSKGAASTNAKRWGNRKQVAGDIAHKSLTTEQRQGHDHADESPPLTTHPPPQVLESESQGGAGAPDPDPDPDPDPSSGSDSGSGPDSERLTAAVLATPRPTLEQARAVAGLTGVTEAEAIDWWHVREASGWMKGTGGGGTTAVGTNWRADLKVYTNGMREQKAREEAKSQRTPSPSHEKRNHHSTFERRDSGDLNAPGRYA